MVWSRSNILLNTGVRSAYQDVAITKRHLDWLILIVVRFTRPLFYVLQIIPGGADQILATCS